jgi:Spy/CpxP family protein refolding chaperone
MASTSRRLSVIALLCGAALASAGILAAQSAPPPPPSGQFQQGPGGRGPMGPRMGGMDGLSIERLGPQLGLSDQQKNAINTLLMEERQSLSTALASLRTARQGLDAAILTVPADDGLLQAQVLQMGTLESQIALARTRTQAKIFALLSGEQQSKVRELVAARDQQSPTRGGR